MFNLNNNSYLIGHLKDTVERIPKDLGYWQEETIKITKLPKPTEVQKLKATEYLEKMIYYEGKLMAYLWVLTALGQFPFVRNFETAHGISYSPGTARFPTKWKYKKVKDV